MNGVYLGLEHKPVDVIDVEATGENTVVTVQTRGKPGDPRDEAEHEYAYDVWAFEAGQNLKKTAKETSIPYQTLWRWHKTYDWRGRWDREWGEVTAPARRGASVKVAARFDEIADNLIALATSPGPQAVAAIRLAAELLDAVDAQSKTGVSVQILQQFGGMSEEEMRKAVGAAMATNMSSHQVERSKKRG